MHGKTILVLPYDRYKTTSDDLWCTNISRADSIIHAELERKKESATIMQ